MYERDRHTRRQKNGQTPHDDKGRSCIASRGKNGAACKRYPLMTQHLDENNLMPQCQSAYRKHHSTESALMKVLSDRAECCCCCCQNQIY